MDIIYNKNSQSIPAIRQNLECGFDPNNIASGREPCQMGWYEWIGKNFCFDKTVLDVGAGMCEGLKTLRDMEAKTVYGQDIDERLRNLDKDLIIDDIKNIPDKFADVITCFDVIEHVINDLDFFINLQRIAKELICITTPNFSRSKAQNHCHCREYTIPQFTNIFKPDELWVASPDGKLNHKLLLRRLGNDYMDFTRNFIKMNHIPEDLSFEHSSVDGKEWPHMCGIFYML